MKKIKLIFLFLIFLFVNSDLLAGVNPNKHYWYWILKPINLDMIIYFINLGMDLNAEYDEYSDPIILLLMSNSPNGESDRRS